MFIIDVDQMQILRRWHDVWCSFRQLNIKKILLSGGGLNHRAAPQILNDGGGEKVDILALDEAGRVSAFRIREKAASILKYWRIVFIAYSLVIFKTMLCL